MQRGRQVIRSLLSTIAIVLAASGAAAQVPLPGEGTSETAAPTQTEPTTTRSEAPRDDGAAEQTSVAAPTSVAASVPAPAAPPVIESPAAAKQQQRCADRVCLPDNLVMGTGYHPFGHLYLLTGLNWMWSPKYKSAVYELETSLPYVTAGLFYVGAWAAAGFRARGAHRSSDGLVLPYPGQPKHAERLAAGLEAGWRIIAADVGYVHDAGAVTRAVADASGTTLRASSGNGVRSRLGLAISDELFTSQFATYRRSCCKARPCEAARAAKFGYAVPCECERTPVGLSLFVYWAHQYFRGSNGGAGLHEDLFGVSLKLGVGL